MKHLPVLIQERLIAGHCISADVVTLSCNYLRIPNIPLSDYVAAVEVQPLADGSFRIIYREIPEELLRFEYEWDRYATVDKTFNVKTMAEVEDVLAYYVTDFSSLVVGSNMYASA